MDIAKNIHELKEEGITFLPAVYSQKECENYINLCEKTVELFKNKGTKLDPKTQVIQNPFRHNTLFIELVYNKILDEVLSKLIDEDYILINSNIINRKLKPEINTGGFTLGNDWHTDSRYVGGVRLEKGFSYIAIIMFNDFTTENGATLYVPKSHLKREKPERNANYEAKQMLGKAGTMVIFDSGLWHKAGASTNNNRWSTYNYYGPWFVKPYFRYPEMLGQEYGKKLNKNLRRLLHYTSTPPLNEEEGSYTVIRE